MYSSASIENPLQLIILSQTFHATLQEPKLAAVRYLTKHLSTYRTNNIEEEKEHDTVKQILHNNKYDTDILNKISRTKKKRKRTKEEKIANKMGKIYVFWKTNCKKITLDKPEGRRRVRRPNLRWIGGVTKDAKRLGIRNWRIKARDRDVWRRLLESAKTLHGL
jgi:hypothetical protein